MNLLPRWYVRSGLALLLAAVLTSVAAAGQPADPFVAPTPRAVPCRQNVYPLLSPVQLLQDNQPSWYRPVTMESIGLSPDADEAEIPALNTTTPNSPRFRIESHFNWVVWRSSNDTWPASEPFVPMITGTGTLIDGYEEYDLTLNSPNINGVLDVGDWLAHNYYTQDNPSLEEVHAALDAHIANKTRMILPVYDAMNGQDIGAPYIFHIARLIEVRLLKHALTKPGRLEGYLEVALLDDDKVCMSTTAIYIPRTVRSAPAR
jgi:hypothetical protein